MSSGLLNEQDGAMYTGVIRRGVTAAALALTLVAGGTSAVSATANDVVVMQSAVAAPRVLVQPTAKVVSANVTVTFGVRASGSGLRYRWQQKVAGRNWESIGRGDGRTFSVKASPDRSGRSFRVVVSNSAGKVASKGATLTVKVVKPRISAQPVGIRIRSGALATYSVRAIGTGLSYRWQKYEKGAWVSIPGATGRSHSLQATRARDGRKTRVVVSNKAGRVASRSVGLSVIATRADPYRVGTAVALTDWRVKLTKSINNAWPGISQWEYDTPPRAGHRYVASRTSITLTGASSSKYPWSDIDVEFVGGNGRTYTETYNVSRDDVLFSVDTMYRGATASFVMVVEIPNSALVGGRWRVADTSDWQTERVAWYATR